MSDKKPARNSWHHTASQAVHNLFKLSRSRSQSTLARRNSMMPAADSGDTPTERHDRHLLNSSRRTPSTSDIERVDRLYSLVTAIARMIAETLYMHDPNNKSLHKLSNSADALLWLSDTRGGVFQGADTISKFKNAPEMFRLSKECLFELGKLITCGLKKYLKKYAALTDATRTDNELLVLLSTIRASDSLRCPDYSRFNLKDLVKLFTSLERSLQTMNSIMLCTHSFR